MSDVIRFTNGYLALPDGTVSPAFSSSLTQTEADSQAVKADLYVSSTSGLILSGQQNFYDSSSSPTRIVDLGGNILCPGLIDVQINGAYGVDFSELSVDDPDGGESAFVEGLQVVARRIVETGCTSFVPTIITQKEELYAKVSLPSFLSSLCR